MTRQQGAEIARKARPSVSPYMKKRWLMRSFYLSQLSSKDYSYLIVYSCILFAQDTWLKIHTNDRHNEFDRIQENLCMTSLKCRRLLVKIFLVGFLLLPYQWFYRQKKFKINPVFTYLTGILHLPSGRLCWHSGN